MIPEPPNGSVIGWGNPIRRVYARIDEFADKDQDGKVENERWFEASDNSMEDPLSWLSLISSTVDEPYLLVKTALVE